MKLIPINGRDGIVAYSKVDDEIYAIASQVNWFLINGRAYSSGRSKRRVSLHGLAMRHFHPEVFPLPKGVTIDHINRDKLDNQIGNLRPASDSLQKANTSRYRNNTSGFKGVCRNVGVATNGKTYSYWLAIVTKDGKRVLSKTFPFTEEGKRNAARAVNAAYRYYYPDVAVPNPEVEIGNPVAEWSDSSGNCNDATQANVSQQPTLR